jgi:rhodanese-related sulfurtransferase
MRLGRIGFDHIVGYLKDGLRALDGRPELTTTTTRVSPALAADLLASEDPPFLVDVRAPGERAQKHLPGSVSLPLNHLAERVRELPMDRTLLVYCAGGYRSSIAASVLQHHAFAHVQELAGGIAAWESAGLAIEKSEV